MDRMIAVVTGAGRGIGKAIALALATNGYETILVSRSGNEIEDVARSILSLGGKAIPLTCDIANPRSVTSLTKQIQSTIGKVSVIINNAGIAPSLKIENTSDEIWRETFATNVDGAFYIIRDFLPGMKSSGSGHIINIASTSALEGFAYTAAYTASKHALLGLSRAIAKELSRSNIKISTICPGFVRTSILEQSVANIVAKTGKDQTAAENQLGKMNRNGRIIAPEEVASAVLSELDQPLDPNGRELVL